MITFRRFSTPSDPAAWSPAKSIARRLMEREDRQSWLVWEMTTTSRVILNDTN